MLPKLSAVRDAKKDFMLLLSHMQQHKSIRPGLPDYDFFGIQFACQAKNRHFCLRLTVYHNIEIATQDYVYCGRRFY